MKPKAKEKGKRMSRLKFACEPVFHLLFNHDIPVVDAVVGIVQKGFLLI